MLEKVNLENGLKFQQEYYKRFYNWKNIGRHWQNFLQGAISVRRDK